MTLKEMRKIKEEKNCSLAYLSEKSGVAFETLQKFFAGETENIPDEMRLAIEDALECAEDKRGCQYPPLDELQDGRYKGQVHEAIARYEEQDQDLTARDRNQEMEKIIARYERQAQETIARYAKSVGKKQGEFTVDDYFAISEDVRVELIDGVLIPMNAPKTVHQQILGMMFFDIMSFIKSKGGDCKPFMAPLSVRLDSDEKTTLLPDLVIVCDKDKVKGWGIMGAPDFVLEVVSKSTRRRDYTKKLQKYADAGVREYWIIDPLKKALVVYDFENEDMPRFYPLKGQVGIGIYNGELQINLDELGEAVREWA